MAGHELKVKSTSSPNTLADLLAAQGVNVWLDAAELRLGLGDSLGAKIDEGLLKRDLESSF